MAPYSTGVVITAADGSELRGFANGRYGEGLPTYLSLIMKQKKKNITTLRFVTSAPIFLFATKKAAKFGPSPADTPWIAVIYQKFPTPILIATREADICPNVISRRIATDDNSH